MGAAQRTETTADAAASRPPLRIEALRDDARLRLWRNAGQSRRLVVAFSGVGRDRRQPPRLEFGRIASADGRDHVLYIADPARSWLNAPGLIEEIVGLVEAEAARIDAGQIVAMGHSMGGYSALVLGGFTRVDVALALSPQLSLDPEIAPDEPRWMMFRKHFPGLRIRQVSDHLASGTQHYIVFGSHHGEAPQYRQMRPAPNVACFMLPAVRHDSVARLHAAGLLEQVVQLAFAGRTRRLRQTLARGMNATMISTETANAEEGVK